MNAKLIKLAKLVMSFKSVTTDKQTLIYNDDLEVGVEVFIEDDSTGEILPAPNGDYTAEDMVITVAEGVITEVKPVEEPEEIEEPSKEPDEEEFAEEVEKTEEIEQVNNTGLLCNKYGFFSKVGYKEIAEDHKKNLILYTLDDLFADDMEQV